LDGLAGVGFVFVNGYLEIRVWLGSERFLNWIGRVLRKLWCGNGRGGVLNNLGLRDRVKFRGLRIGLLVGFWKYRFWMQDIGYRIQDYFYCLGNIIVGV
jgi:hypothetical protein